MKKLNKSIEKKVRKELNTYMKSLNEIERHINIINSLTLLNPKIDIRIFKKQ